MARCICCEGLPYSKIFESQSDLSILVIVVASYLPTLGRYLNLRMNVTRSIGYICIVHAHLPKKRSEAAYSMEHVLTEKTILFTYFVGFLLYE